MLVDLTVYDLVMKSVNMSERGQSPSNNILIARVLKAHFSSVRTMRAIVKHFLSVRSQRFSPTLSLVFNRVRAFARVCRRSYKLALDVISEIQANL